MAILDFFKKNSKDSVKKSPTSVQQDMPSNNVNNKPPQNSQSQPDKLEQVDRPVDQPKAGQESEDIKNRRSINLIPGPTEEEIVVEVTKTKRSLSGFIFIAFIVFVAVVVLGFNLYSKIRLNNVQQRLAETENQIATKQLEELQLKNLNNKLDAYAAVKGQDYNSNNVLEYLLQVAEGLGEVKTLYLDNTLMFELKGTASSYTNVARLWHDMAREEEYFENISLNRVNRTSDTGDVQFIFSGYLVEENITEL